MPVLVSRGTAEKVSAVPVSDAKAQVQRSSSPLLTFWHLLSLDAPTVAVVWTFFLAVIAHTPLSSSLAVAMAVAVWMIYASDRLLDARPIRTSPQKKSRDVLEARHLFHHLHRAGFAAMLLASSAALGVLLPRLPAPALHLYLAEGVALAAYFLLIHAGPSLAASKHRLPKELLVGPFFSAATFVPVVSRRTGLRTELLPLAILFAALCSLNCLYIYAWEHSTPSDPDWTATWLVANLDVLSFFFVTASLLFCLGPARLLHLPAGSRSYPLACAASGCLLAALHAFRRHIAPLTLRTAADAALLTPLAILPFLGLSFA